MSIRRFMDTGEWTTRRYLSLLGSILIWAIVAVDAWYLWPTQLHGSTSMVIVSGHSMEPTYFTGDLVIARKAEPSVGDVIVYAPAGLGGSQIVHRIIGGNAIDGWQMQGDNNDFIDPFTPKGAEVKGVVMVHYANFGRVTVLLLNPMVWAFILLISIVLLVWWGGDTCEDDDDEDDPKGQDAPETQEEDEPGLIDRLVDGAEVAVSRIVDSGRSTVAAALALSARHAFKPRHAAPVPRRSELAYLRGSAFVVVLGLVAFLWPSSASASRLTVNTRSGPGSMTYASCMTKPVFVSAVGAHNGNNYSYIYVKGLPANCVGLPITVALYEGSTSAANSVSGVVRAGDNSLAIAYHQNQVTTVVVTVGGWVTLATWGGVLPTFSCEGVNASGTVVAPSCAFTSSSGSGWSSGGNSTGNTFFNGVTNAPYVAVTIDLGQLGGFTPYVVSPSDAVVTTLAPGKACASLPVITIMRPVQNYAYAVKEFWGGLNFSTDPGSATAASVCPQ